MVDEAVQTVESSCSPGAMLKAARESQDLSEREAADSLNWMPGYVAIVERDDYAALRRPSFARGYVKAFGRLVGLNEQDLMAAFNALDTMSTATSGEKMPPREPVPLQKTGLGVIVGLGSLCALVFVLWWVQENIS